MLTLIALVIAFGAGLYLGATYAGFVNKLIVFVTAMALAAFAAFEKVRDFVVGLF